MLDTTEKIIRDRAYFIAGRDARFRVENDPLVESAINDVAQYLDSLPADAEQPTISSATTTSRSNILTLHWLVATSKNLKTIAVQFYGNGLCTARWSERGGLEHRRKNISVREVLDLDFPAKVAKLRSMNE